MFGPFQERDAAPVASISTPEVHLSAIASRRRAFAAFQPRGYFAGPPPHSAPTKLHRPRERGVVIDALGVKALVYRGAGKASHFFDLATPHDLPRDFSSTVD